MRKPPDTIRECVIELITCIESTATGCTQSQKGDLLDLIRVGLIGYVKLKEYVEESLP